MNNLWNNKNHTKISKEIAEFTAGEDAVLDSVLVKCDAIGSVAHAAMLKKIGILKEDELIKLKKALRKIISLSNENKFIVEPKDEDVHTKVENYLTREVGEAGKKIHTGRSRNDQILVDIRLYTKGKLLDLKENILNMCSVLIDFSDANKDVPMPGYTHMQKAMPSSVSIWALSYVESLLDDLVLIKTAYRLNNQNPLGSAAGYGVPLNLDRKMTTDLLGFEKIQNNVLYVQNSRGKIESVVLAALSQVMLDLSRLANDLILFSTDEFGFFDIPDDFCTGSSIMPKKRNPDILELIRGKANRIFSYYFQTIGVVKDLPSGYNRDVQETKEPLLRGLILVNSCSKISSSLLKGLKINREKLNEAFNSQIFAADKALELVTKGVPFRDAYKEVEYNFYKPREIDPAENIRLKKHIGASGNLNVNKLKKQIGKESNILKLEKKNFQKKLDALIK